MLPHSFLFGHLLVLAKAIMKYKVPTDFHSQQHIAILVREFPELASAGLLYMDTWPISYEMVAVFDPEMMAQFTQDVSLPKFFAQGEVEFKPLTNAEDLVHLEGQTWKQARAMFNPGFSAKNLLSLIPDFVEETLVFRDKLRAAAQSGEQIELERWTIALTADVISRAVL